MKPSNRQSLAEQLKGLGQRGVLIKAAERGDITELSCAMAECLHPKGREYFDKKAHPPSDWAPSVDHYPKLQKDGGHLVLGNVRLAHVLCNRVDYAKNHGIKHDKDRAKSRQSQVSGLHPRSSHVSRGRDGRDS